MTQSTGLAARVRGEITYDSEFGHVCTCTVELSGECEGHPAGPYDRMGETVYCDGSCSPTHATYEPTVHVDRSIEPTEGGSYYYVCGRCGAGGWSGC
jgi:hypothetical protein